jgi:murein DD-endopeptidase MepM/ murein hydrolase activator NlpD
MLKIAPPMAIAIAAGILALLAFEPRAPGHVLVVPYGPLEDDAAKVTADECPRHTLPDHGVCVRVPSPEDDGPESPSYANVHRERTGLWTVYDQIPRRPERPADYDAYVYPVPPGLPGGHSVMSGYDLDRPDHSQRRGPSLRATGHGAVDLAQERGAPAKMVELEHQEGPADVVYAGPLFGTTVVTRHTLREGGELRDYVLLFGHLDAVAPGIAPGVQVRAGDVVGFVGDTGSPGLVHLHLEARRVREGVDVTKVLHGRIVANEVSIVCDPRNVLPLLR